MWDAPAINRKRLTNETRQPGVSLYYHSRIRTRRRRSPLFTAFGAALSGRRILARDGVQHALQGFHQHQEGKRFQNQPSIGTQMFEPPRLVWHSRKDNY